MCKVIEDMRKEERAEGRVEGRAEGLLDNISALMKNLSVSAEKAMELLGVPAGEREGLLKKLPVTCRTPLSGRQPKTKKISPEDGLCAGRGHFYVPSWNAQSIIPRGRL